MTHNLKVSIFNKIIPIEGKKSIIFYKAGKLPARVHPFSSFSIQDAVFLQRQHLHGRARGPDFPILCAQKQAAVLQILSEAICPLPQIFFVRTAVFLQVPAKGGTGRLQNLSVGSQPEDLISVFSVGIPVLGMNSRDEIIFPVCAQINAVPSGPGGMG